MGNAGTKWTEKQRARFDSTVEPLSKRITDRVEFDTNGGCWLWTGAMTWGNGYGNIGYRGRAHGAHRASYETFVGPIPPGLCVCHRCDVRACVNPAHLFLGDHKANMADMRQKGRHARLAGSRAPGAILHEANITPIRRLIADDFSNREIGFWFGVSPDVINAIRAGRSWTCVAEEGVTLNQTEAAA